MIRMKMPDWFRHLLYGVFCMSLFSGIGFFILNTWVSVEGDFGPEKHPVQFPLLKVHGFAAFAMLMSYGAVLGAHVPMSWRSGRLRGIGLTLCAIIAVQVLSAWMLYYLSDDGLRGWVSWLHLGVGCSLPVLLLTHILQGRRNSVPTRVAKHLMPDAPA